MIKKIISNIKYAFLKIAGSKIVLLRPKKFQAIESAVSFYDFKLKTNSGKDIDFNSFRGKKVLIVNVASACGYTAQYRELEKLHKKYQDKLFVLGFPSDNFGHQEPGNDEEIARFCEINFGVTFPLFQKSSVRGKAQNPLFYWLSHEEQNGWNHQPPTWNFCKYLVNEKGELMAFFSPSLSPLSKTITNLLQY